MEAHGPPIAGPWLPRDSRVRAGDIPKAPLSVFGLGSKLGRETPETFHCHGGRFLFLHIPGKVAGSLRARVTERGGAEVHLRCNRYAGKERGGGYEASLVRSGHVAPNGARPPFTPRSLLHLLAPPFHASAF